jgi:hypothetical protein
VGPRTPDEPELTTAIRWYVIGTGSAARYLKLLNGNFMTMDTAQRSLFLQQLAAPARQASNQDLDVLLDSEWRSRLTASWLIALDRRQQFRQRIGELLMASELTYAGQGYCLAGPLRHRRGRRTAGHLPGRPPPAARQALRPALGTRRPAPPRRAAHRQPRRPLPDRRRALAGVDMMVRCLST